MNNFLTSLYGNLFTKKAPHRALPDAALLIIACRGLYYPLQRITCGE